MDNHKISCEIKKSHRAKHIRITIYRNCKVVVTYPCFVDISTVKNFIRKKTEWIQKKLDEFISIRKQPDNNRTLTLDESKKEAHNLISELIEKFNKFYKFDYNAIRVKNHGSRWGSCSLKRNLNFNYKMLFLPRRLSEYIVVHELCHLKELNHSNKFWHLVGLSVPNYKEIRKELRKYH